MKKTTLYDTHLKLNAKMTAFGGYEMPVQYTGVKNEHLAVREKVGVFDVSHMGEFYISGPNSFNLLQFICSNDISKIAVGKAQYNYLPNETGGIVDDLIIYRLEKERYLLVINASNINKDWNWIQKHNHKFKALLEDHSKTTGLLAIQGPKAIIAMKNEVMASKEELLKGVCHEIASVMKGHLANGTPEVQAEVMAKLAEMKENEAAIKEACHADIGDGLDLEGFKNFLVKYGPPIPEGGEPPSPEQIAGLFSLVDADGDGKCQVDEMDAFAAIMKSEIAAAIA
jgi:hypothetical protein